jgi:hypothetical protein
MTPWGRVLREKRGVVVALTLLTVVNVAVYFFIVRPLGVRAAGVAERAASAAAHLEAAMRDEAAARDLVSGKSDADKELATFYDEVLPNGPSAARRLTYARLPALARGANVRYEERQSDFDLTMADKGLGRLETRMLLVGRYSDIRRFLHELETSSEFVIIDAVTIAEAPEGEQQSLTIQLSTYYRLEPHGA